jgi:hypothetical protein
MLWAFHEVPFPSEGDIYHFGGIILAALAVLRWVARDVFEFYGYCRKRIRRWRRRGP